MLVALHEHLQRDRWRRRVRFPVRLSGLRGQRGRSEAAIQGLPPSFPQAQAERDVTLESRNAILKQAGPAARNVPLRPQVLLSVWRHWLAASGLDAPTHAA